MFKSLEKDGSGKIELDLQQVCESTTKAAVMPTLVVQTVCGTNRFLLTVAVSGNLLTLKTRQERSQNLIKV